MASEQLKNYLKNNCLGRRNAVKSPELEAALQVSGNELRRQVNRLRRKKIPVCSGLEGYFYARNAGEIYATIRSLKDMVYGLSQAIDGLEGALESFGEVPWREVAALCECEREEIVPRHVCICCGTIFNGSGFRCTKCEIIERDKRLNKRARERRYYRSMMSGRKSTG